MATAAWVGGFALGGMVVATAAVGFGFWLGHLTGAPLAAETQDVAEEISGSGKLQIGKGSDSETALFGLDEQMTLTDFTASVRNTGDCSGSLVLGLVSGASLVARYSVPFAPHAATMGVSEHLQRGIVTRTHVNVGVFAGSVDTDPACTGSPNLEVYYTLAGYQVAP